MANTNLWLHKLTAAAYATDEDSQISNTDSWIDLLTSKSLNTGEDVQVTTIYSNEHVADDNELPQEVQFSGIGDYALSGYMYHVLQIIALLGIVGNSVVFTFLLKQRNSSSGVMEALMINQSIVDLLMSTMLLISANFTVPEEFDDMSWKSELVCRVFRTQMPLAIFFSTSVYNLVAIALEQYMQIVHPVFYHNHIKNVKARAFIIGTWTIGVLFNVLLTLPTSGIIVSDVSDNDDDDGDADMNHESNGANNLANNSKTSYVCSEYNYNLNEAGKQLTGLMSSIIYYFLPLLIIVYTFLHILIRLQRKRYQVGPLSQTSLFRSVKISVFKTMTLFCSVFIICWSLNSIVHILSYFHTLNYSFYKSALFSCSIIIFYGCCAINPLLYVVRYRKFREAIRGIASKCHKQHCSNNIVTVAIIELNTKASI